MEATHIASNPRSGKLWILIEDDDDVVLLYIFVNLPVLATKHFEETFSFVIVPLLAHLNL